MWREGHTWEKGDLQATKRTLSRKAGAAAASPLGSLQFQVSRSATGQGAACVARLGEQGETARRGPERAKGGGGPVRLPRVPRARHRGGRQGARQAPGRGGPRSVASLPPGERKYGGPDWGPGGMGSPGAASNISGGFGEILADSRCSWFHHVGGCRELPERVHSAEQRGPRA